MAPGKVGRLLAKGVGIDVDYRTRHYPSEAVQSASSSIHPVDTYVEAEPSVQDWLKDHFVPTAAGVRNYIRRLFPFYNWIWNYNLQWLIGDIIAGVTVGFVVIPQGMAYAILAQLPPQYGLYTSFVGVILYWAFATSKDITIGTVAVMSTLVGNIIVRIRLDHPEFSPDQIARALAVVAGSVLLFIGLTRLGWVVEFIPLVAISSFMTGAAINIAVGQVPGLLGISGINTRESTYKVVINTLKALPNAKLDSAMGVSALVMLYIIRSFCNFMAERQPTKKKMWFFIGTLRMAFVIVLYILISFLVNRTVTDASKAAFKILGPVPSGFTVHSAPTMTIPLLTQIAGDIPVTIIVLLIEHISISKSFGRINNYVIDPSQELVAIGFTNILGPFLGAYPATGSFSRTAIKSKAGVRTPFAGIFTAVIILLALYALTGVFFFIPSASLSGLIIHAVGDLITPPNVVYQFWQVAPLDAVFFFVGVFVIIFVDIETGVYTTMIISLVVLLIRLALTRGSFLGRARVLRVSKDMVSPNGDNLGSEKATRDAYIPIDHCDGSNPNIDVESPYPGVIIYRFNEAFNYTNSGRLMDELTAYALRTTRPTQSDQFAKLGDRPWNNPGPRRGKHVDATETRPTLHAIILDCSAINHVDVTSIQALIDTRNQLDRHASPESVEWHLAHINNPWARRSFAAAGFGFPSPASVNSLPQWKPIYSVAALSDASSTQKQSSVVTTKDMESGDGVERIPSQSVTGSSTDVNVALFSGKTATLQGVNRPFFHIDIAAAVENAVANAENKSGSDANSLKTA